MKKGKFIVTPCGYLEEWYRDLDRELKDWLGGVGVDRTRSALKVPCTYPETGHPDGYIRCDDNKSIPERPWG